MPDHPTTDDTAPAHGRRRFLGALAIAPLLPIASACTTAGAAAQPAGAASSAAAASGAPATPATAEAPADPYRALREQPLAGDPEPALAFRALRSRGGAR